MRRLRLQLALMLLPAFGSCTVKLISDYDEIIDRGVIDIERRMDLHLIQKESAPGMPYSRGFYDSAHVDLGILKSRSEVTPLDAGTFKLLGKLDTLILDIQIKDSANTSSSGYYRISREQIDHLCQSIESLELAKKRNEHTE